MLVEVVLDGAASRSTGLWKPGMALMRLLHFALVKSQLAPFSALFSRSPENAVFVFKAANLTGTYSTFSDMYPCSLIEKRKDKSGKGTDLLKDIGGQDSSWWDGCPLHTMNLYLVNPKQPGKSFHLIRLRLAPRHSLAQ